MYTSIPCPEFLTSNLLITHENFVDYEDDEDESSKSQGGVLTEEEDLGPDLSFEALEVLGYKCGVVECGKVLRCHHDRFHYFLLQVVLVSKFATSMVALNRLKKHFSQIHRHLNSGQFIYETQYRGSSDSPAPPTAPPPSLPPPSGPSPVIVYQCPALLRNRKSGEPRPCNERMLDANALR